MDQGQEQAIVEQFQQAQSAGCKIGVSAQGGPISDWMLTKVAPPFVVIERPLTHELREIPRGQVQCKMVSNQGEFRFASECVACITLGQIIRAEIKVPRELIEPNRRTNARYTVPAGFPLRGQVQLMGENLVCEILDISHSGARVKFENTSLGDIVEQMRGRVVVMTPGICYDGMAQVRWFTDDIAGIFLPEMESVSPDDAGHPWVQILHRVAEATQAAA